MTRLKVKENTCLLLRLFHFRLIRLFRSVCLGNSFMSCLNIVCALYRWQHWYCLGGELIPLDVGEMACQGIAGRLSAQDRWPSSARALFSRLRAVHALSRGSVDSMLQSDISCSNVFILPLSGPGHVKAISVNSEMMHLLKRILFMSAMIWCAADHNRIQTRCWSAPEVCYLSAPYGFFLLWMESNALGVCILCSMCQSQQNAGRPMNVKQACSTKGFRK